MVVAGLVEELGDAARAQTYERKWERDGATWRAVLEALDQAAAGRSPAATRSSAPAWLAPLTRTRVENMATRWSHSPAFETVRTLERLGLVELEPDDTYVLAAVGGLGGRGPGRRAATLRDDPELVERVVWRMFEVEGGGEVSLANLDKFTAEGWQAAFLELVADGTLPRERVLRCALAALNRDFSAYRAGWFHRLYDALEPSAAELARDQGSLRALLRSPIPAVVGFAVSHLKALHGHGGIDADATLAALPAAVVTGPKTTAIRALRLAGDLAAEPGLAGAVCDIAAAALEHPNADVQAAAGKLMTRLGAGDRVAQAADLLEPSVQVALLGRRTPASGVDDDPAPPRESAAPAPASTTGEDVVDRVAALLEDAADPIELELVLAGLAALQDPATLRPLIKRATAILKRGPRDGPSSFWLRGQVARLVVVAGGATADSPHPRADVVESFLQQRLAGVARIVAGTRPPRVLLATPDDAAGWLAPRTLIDRLERLALPPDRHDLIAALLRLHPDGRADALRRLQSVGSAASSAVLAPVGYALGSPPPTVRRRRARLEDVATWVAASRAREPFGTDEWLASRGVRGSGRSGPLDAGVVFAGRPFTWTERGHTHEGMHWTWSTTVADPVGGGTDDEPTAIVGTASEVFGGPTRDDLVGWLATTWPHESDHFLLQALDPVLRAATDTEVSHDAVHVLAALGAHPGRLGRLAEVVVAAGLSAAKADQRAVAVDAVLHLGAAGRLDAAGLGRGLAAFRGPATLTRMATSMRDAALDGPWARALVVDALAAALPAYEPGDRGIHALLDLLREETLRDGRPTPSALRPWLERFSGRSRASRTARALLA